MRNPNPMKRASMLHRLTNLILGKPEIDDIDPKINRKVKKEIKKKHGKKKK